MNPFMRNITVQILEVMSQRAYSVAVTSQIRPAITFANHQPISDSIFNISDINFTSLIG